MARDLWGNINTLFEIGLEIYRLTHAKGETKGADKDTATAAEKITDGVLLISNDKDVLIAVSESAASQLSDAARAVGTPKDEYIIFSGAETAVPLFELSKTHESVRDKIVSEESLRATLCGNCPEYVKTHNMNAPPGERIEDADAPPCLFLQKQLDNAADSTRSEVNEFQERQAARESVFDRNRDDVLEMER